MTAILAGFGIATAAPVFTVLHEFTGVGGDGESPVALIQGMDGNFYGTTREGGNTGCFGRGCGTIFRMTPTGAVTILHVFNGTTAGANPTTLIEGADGNFYGTTLRGGGSACGGSDCGTIFRMTPTGAVTILHVFNDTPAGANPTTTTLIEGADGNFYGTTDSGGGSACGCGTVFKMTPAGAFTVLHVFNGSATDGGWPSSPLLQATDGNFYGTTAYGGGTDMCAGAGSNPACGTVFKMTPVGDVTILHAFRGGTTDGAQPTALVQGTDGDFYGTTSSGGNFDLGSCFFGCGTFFKIAPDGTITLLHAFYGLGMHPNVLLQTSDGNFYGTTDVSCIVSLCGPGAVFKITPAGTIFSVHGFSYDAAGGVIPRALIQGTDGNLYGTSGGGCIHLFSPRCSTGAAFRLAAHHPSTSDDLVVDFGASGVWLLFDGNTSEWAPLPTAPAKNMVTGDLDGNRIDEVIVDFGPAYGLWVWANNANLYQLHPSTATRMATGDLDGDGRADLLIDVPGFGIWVWSNNTSWFQLHPSRSNDIVMADLDGNGQQEAIIDFPGQGLWVWDNNTSWYQLHSFNSRLMTAGDVDGNGHADLIVDFAGYGIWNHANNTAWSQVHSFNASHLAAGDVDGNGTSDLIVDFGSIYGIWKLLNGTTWSQLHTLTSTNILTADLDGNGKAEVIVDFGAGGLWEYANNRTWFQLHSVSPGVIAVGHINAPGP